MNAQQIAHSLTIVWLLALMMRIGLSVSLADVWALAGQKKLLFKVLVANFLVVPLIAFALLKCFQPAPYVAAGFLILTAFPGAPFGPAFTAVAKGDVGFAVGLMTCLVTLSVPFSPLLLGSLLRDLSDSGPITIHYGTIITTLASLQLAPLWIGLAAGELLPSLRGKPATVLRILSNALFGVLCVMIVLSEWRAIFEFCHKAVVGMTIFFLSSLCLGYAIGGADRTKRRAAALVTTVRNLAAALVIVSENFPGTPAALSVLAYSLLSAVGSLAAAAIRGRSAGRSRPD